MPGLTRPSLHADPLDVAPLNFPWPDRNVLDVTEAGAPGLEPTRPSGKWRAGAWLVIAAVSLTALYVWSYRDCTSAFFHFDDFWVLAAASRIHLRSPLDVAQFFQLPALGFVLYRPISTTLYFYLLHQCFGYDPAAYHATQIGFHILNALLVYAIADTLFFSRAMGLASALVYATAPGHAIAACWNALFTMTGTAFFYLLALWVWLRLDSRWRVPVTLLLFCVALLAGEHAASFPVVLTLTAVLLEPRCDWRRCLREQGGFYLIATVYVAVKLYYLHYVFPRVFSNPGIQAYVLAGYGMRLEPLSILRHIGHYCGFAVDLVYHALEPDGRALAAGVLIAVSAAIATGCVLTGRWTARPLRVAAFGLDLFIVGLGPILAFPAHIYSYYVGIAALGTALALVGFAQAVPRMSRLAPSALIGATLAMYVLSTAVAVRRSDEFRFFYGFSRGASRWLYTLAVATQSDAAVQEVVVPRTPLTDMIFNSGEAHKLFLCARYRVLTSPAIQQVEPADGRVIVRDPLPLPWSYRSPQFWTSLRRDCAS